MNKKYSYVFFVLLILIGVVVLNFAINYRFQDDTQPKVLAVSTHNSSIPDEVDQNNKSIITIENPEIESKAYIIKKYRGETLIEKNSDDRLPPASTTKMMTALVAIDQYNLSDEVTIKSPYNIGANIQLQSNEVISLENLLYGLLLNSGNDVAVSIASIDNYDDFVSRMNIKSSEMGLKNTQFINATGFDHPDHYSSAHDLAIIGEAIIENKDLADIVATKSTIIYDTSRTISHRLVNRNKLLDKQGVIGIKTGFTDLAGEVLVTALIHNSETYIISVMGGKDRFGDTEILINWLETYLDK